MKLAEEIQPSVLLAGWCGRTRGTKLMSSPHGRVDEDLDASELLDRCGDELAVVVDEVWTHRVVNPRALSPMVGANVDGINRR